MGFLKQETMKRYSPLILRIGLGLVLLWFGTNQVFHSQLWIVYLPQFTSSFPISQASLVFANGTFEIILGLMILFGVYTRIIAIIVSLHLLSISLAVGYNEIGVRDFGLFMASLAIALNGSDEWCLDKIVNP